VKEGLSLAFRLYLFFLAPDNRTTPFSQTHAAFFTHPIEGYLLRPR
jgi:hypothetical protein